MNVVVVMCKGVIILALGKAARIRESARTGGGHDVTVSAEPSRMVRKSPGRHAVSVECRNRSRHDAQEDEARYKEQRAAEETGWK